MQRCSHRSVDITCPRKGPVTPASPCGPGFVLPVKNAPSGPDQRPALSRSLSALQSALVMLSRVDDRGTQAYLTSAPFAEQDLQSKVDVALQRSDHHTWSHRRVSSSQDLSRHVSGNVRYLHGGCNHDTTDSVGRSRAGGAGSIDQATPDKALKSLLARDA